MRQRPVAPIKFSPACHSWRKFAFRASILLAFLLSIPFTSASADVINLICQMSYGNTGSMANRNVWIDTDKKTFTYGGWIGMTGDDPNHIWFVMPLQIDPYKYRAEQYGNTQIIDRATGELTVLTPDNKQFNYHCVRGANPMPSPKF